MPEKPAAPSTDPAYDAIRHAQAVRLVWTRAILDDYPEPMRWAAHPLGLIASALEGETEPANLGCGSLELRMALEADGDLEAFRLARAEADRDA